MAVLRWVGFLPVALIGAALWSGLILRVGDLLVGGWTLTSAFVIYVGASLFPMTTVLIALKVAPRPTNSVKWVSLIPHAAIGFLVFIPVLIIALLYPSSGPERLPASADSLSRSVSPYWQVLLFNGGYIVGIFLVAFKSVREIVE